MNAVYEYLFTGLMLIVIYGASVQMVGIVTVPMQGISERQELQSIGEKVMIQVLSKGTPWDWGNTLSATGPDYFGLGDKEETTRQTYTLDINKVQRLSSSNLYHLDPKTVQRTLNLERNFGFAIQVSPIFDIDVTKVGADDIFTVSVNWHEDGFPVPNANITAKIFYAEVPAEPTVIYGNSTQLTSVTGVDGSTLTQLDFTGGAGNPAFNGPMKILVVGVDHLGVKAYRIYIADNWQTLSAYKAGKHVLFSDAYSLVSSNPILHEILAVKDFQSGSQKKFEYNILSVNATLIPEGVKPTLNGSFKSYGIVNPEPVVTGLLVVKKSGLYYLAYLTKDVTTTFSTSPSLTTYPPGVRLDRLVSIEDSLYYLRLYIWRLSE